MSDELAWHNNREISVHTDTFSLTHGEVEIRYPAEMTVDDIKDFEDRMVVFFRGAKRRAEPQKTADK